MMFRQRGKAVAQKARGCCGNAKSIGEVCRDASAARASMETVAAANQKHESGPVENVGDSWVGADSTQPGMPLGSARRHHGGANPPLRANMDSV